jgi:hypothetical protein
MDRQGDEIHLTQDEARGGSTPNIVRYILAISLALAVILLSVVWMTGAFSSSQGSHGGAVTNQAAPTPAAG